MLTPANLLLEFVLSLLVPFLATGPLTDAALARRAAEDTIAAYKAAGQDQLITIAQLVVFALAALDNLRLSMPADLSLSMKLKLRGNAGTLNRASLHATAALDRQRRDIPPPQRDQQQVLASLEAAKTVVQQALAAQALATATPSAATPPNPAPIAAPLAAATTTTPMAPLVAPLAANANAPSGQRPPRSPSPGNQADLAWASAMTEVAAEYTAELPHLSAADQQTHLARIAALSEVSAMLGRGDAPPLKARLLTSTTLKG